MRVLFALVGLLVVANAFLLDVNHGARDLRKTVMREARGTTAAAGCPAVTCSTQDGQSCATTDTFDGYCTSDSLICNSTDYCQSTSAYQQIGASCSKNSDCISNLCVSGTCNRGYDVGAPCTMNYDCALYDVPSSSYSASCVNKRCAGLAQGINCSRTRDDQCLPPLSCGFDNTCIQAQNAGSSCYNDDNCVVSAGCVNNVCTTYLAAGVACNTDDDQCGGITHCAPNDATTQTGKCTEIVTLGVGAFCEDLLNCKEGLACHNQTCVQGYAYSSSSKTVCTDNSQCTKAYETCQCGGDGQFKCYIAGDYVANPTGLKSALEGVLNCINSCAQNDYSCLASKCSKSYCTYYALNYNAKKTYYSTFGLPQCFLNYFEHVASNTYIVDGYLKCSTSGNPTTSDASTLSATFVLFVATLLLFV